VLLVHPSLPVNSVKDLVEYAKARPGKLNYGASGIASSGHLRGEQFQLEAGVKLQFVPYIDGGATLRGLLTNEIQVSFDTLPGSIGMIQGGKIRLVAVGSPERWFLVPDVPTMSESGYGGLVSQWIGAYVRADTPPAIVDKLAKALKEAACLGSRRPPADAAIAQGQRCIVNRRKPGQQQVRLGHVGHGLGARRAGQETGQPPQQGGLADAAAAQQTGRAPGGKFEREIARNQAIAEGDARITHEKGRSSRQVRHQSLRRY
jgi:hypothetical protein